MNPGQIAAQRTTPAGQAKGGAGISSKPAWIAPAPEPRGTLEPFEYSTGSFSAHAPPSEEWFSRYCAASHIVRSAMVGQAWPTLTRDQQDGQMSFLDGQTSRCGHWFAPIRRAVPTTGDPRDTGDYPVFDERPGHVIDRGSVIQINLTGETRTVPRGDVIKHYCSLGEKGRSAWVAALFGVVTGDAYTVERYLEVLRGTTRGQGLARIQEELNRLCYARAEPVPPPLGDATKDYIPFHPLEAATGSAPAKTVISSSHWATPAGQAQGVSDVPVDEAALAGALQRQRNQITQEMWTRTIVIGIGSFAVGGIAGWMLKKNSKK